MFLPLFRYWNSLQLVCYSCLNVYCRKMSPWGDISPWEEKNSQGPNSGEQGSWGATLMFLLDMNSFIAVRQRPLWWCNTQLFFMFGSTQMTLYRDSSRYFRYKYWLTVWSWGRNSLWTYSCISNKQISMHLIFDFTIFAFFGLGEVAVLWRLVSDSSSNT